MKKINKTGSYSPRAPKLKVPKMRTKGTNVPRYSLNKRIAALTKKMRNP